MDDELADLIANATRVQDPEAAFQLSADTTAVLVARLDDSIAEALARLQRLRALVASGNSLITDAGLRSLERLQTLEALDLEWSDAITGGGLQSFAKLPRLKWLDLSFCAGVTAPEVAELRQALPNCEIEFGG